jgi:hypothetical protein
MRRALTGFVVAAPLLAYCALTFLHRAAQRAPAKCVTEYELMEIVGADYYNHSACLVNPARCCDTCTNLENGGSLKCSTENLCKMYCFFSAVSDCLSFQGAGDCGVHILWNVPDCDGTGTTTTISCYDPIFDYCSTIWLP